MKGGCEGCATAEAPRVDAELAVETTAAAAALDEAAEEETTTGVEVNGCCNGGG